MKRINKSSAFTLIELMIVVAIIGILAAVAIPRFADMITKSKEGATKGNLTTIKSALNIYYGDNEGVYPVGTGDTNGVLGSLTLNRKYLKEIPNTKLPKNDTYSNPGHGESQAVIGISSGIAANFNDAAGWAYVNAPGAQDWGLVYVNCTHKDTQGKYWTSY